MKIRYTPPDEAAEIILERKTNESLQVQLTNLTGGNEPQGCFAIDYEFPPAVYAEYIARPTVADIAFAKESLAAGLTPWWATYEQDVFTTTNVKKTDMLRPPLSMSKGQDTRSWIVNVQDRQRRNTGIGACPTNINDYTVTEYWQALRRLVLPTVGLGAYLNNVVDLSESYARWSDSGGTDKKSRAYYPAIMGMYTARAVLFVDYDRFPDFLPIATAGYEAATDALGLEPVIVKYNPEQVEARSLDGNGRLIGQRQTDLTRFTTAQLTCILEEGESDAGEQ